MSRGLRASALVLAFAAAEAGAAEDAFSIQELRPSGRIVQADLRDMDGDGRGDLVCIGVEGMPPDERREIRVFFGETDGRLPEQPDWRGPLPSGVAAYDLAEVDEIPGFELILLRRDRLSLVSLAGRKPTTRDLPTGAAPTMAAAGDERGVDQLAIARSGLGEAPRLVVPGMGWTAVLAPSGEVLGRLDVGARANYYVPRRPGPVVSESEVEIFFDHPRLSIGDVNGDGRGDIVSATRHELRVFLQDAEGRFPTRPSRRIALGRLSAEDHVRNSGSVRVEGADFDGDGRLDLLIAAASGSVFASKTRFSIHLNRGGSWQLDDPDQVFRAQGGASGTMTIDLEGDGQLELIEARIPTGVLEVVEVLVTRAIDTEVSIYRRGTESLFETRPWHTRKLGLGFSFDTFRPLGFVPNLEADLNGDGMRDLMGSGDGQAIEVFLGHRERGYPERHAKQDLDTSGRIRFGDLDADGLADFVIYAPRRPDLPLRVGVNRGVLPGTQRTPVVREAGPSSAP